MTTYRADIDGLRGIAVLSIILFHIDKSLLPGGFVGVDIFFVISGFLITGNILRDLDAGRFSLLEFYARRVKLKHARYKRFAFRRLTYRRRAHASACACPRRLKPPLYAESKTV